MKKGLLKKLGLGAAVSVLSLSSCGASAAENPNEVLYKRENLIQESFGGLGVEWGVYEDTDKIMEGGWDTIISHMDHLGAARIRMMVSYEWFLYNFDAHDASTKEDDTWSYNFTNKYAKNMLDILEYCEVHHIDVAFGAWNVVGSVGADDEWHMMDDVTSDIRWAKISSDVMDFLVNKKGFTCIKWFVSSNEPNYLGIKGASKNYNNTYQKWEQGVKNVREALDKIGLNNIGIIGGDVTGFSGIKEYLPKIAANIPDKVGDYGVHIYLSNYSVDIGEMGREIRSFSKEIKEIDPRLGNEIQANIWEGGLLDGKTANDCQASIGTTNYAVKMVDYTIQSLASGINGICYWNFDDAMNFMYTATTMTPKEWGMFSSLAEASSGKQELRPWYHTSSLMCHLFKKENRIYASNINDENLEETFRSVATINHEKNQAGIVAVNAGVKSVEKTFRIDEKIQGDKVYVYIFNANEYRLGEDGYIVPNYVLDASLNDNISITIPKTTALILSTERL